MNNGKKTVEHFLNIILSIALIVLFTASCKVIDSYDNFNEQQILESTAEIEQNSYLEGPYNIDRVVDGDTVRIFIDDKSTSVRLIGIDTPESVHPKKEKNVPEGTIASDYTKSLLEDCESVYLEYGEQRYDRYGRLLAYIYIDEDTMLNAKLVEDGYAKVYMVKPNLEYKDYFESLQNEASENNRGLWPTGIFDN